MQVSSRLRGPVALVIGGLLATSVWVDGPAAADPAVGAAHEQVAELDLDTARAAREREAGVVAALDVAVRRTADELAALDLALLDASTRLAASSQDVEVARLAAADAEEHERTAAAALVAADLALDQALGTWRDDRDRVAARAVQAYKHGSSATSEVLVRGVTGANDWHEVAVTLETVARLTADDRALVDAAATTTRSTASLRAAATEARRDAREASAQAARLIRRLEEVRDRHAHDRDAVATAVDERRRLLDELETDVAARTALLTALDARVAALERAAPRVLVPIVVDLDPFGPPPAWARGLPGSGPTWSAAIDATAQRHGIDPRLLAALVWTESNFRPDAVSHAGALGLAQLMPGTAAGLGVDPRDPLANLDGGARYLRAQLDRFGRVDLALAAYNAGPGRVERVGRVPDIVETQLYVVRVLERYERLGG